MMERTAWILTEQNVPYPRICAHRGFNTVAPENTIPAFATAVSLGADEIEFDLWPTLDGVLIVNHDPDVDRTSNGHGNISDLTFDDISQLDLGSRYLTNGDISELSVEEIEKLNTGRRFSTNYAGLGFATFEDVLQKFGRSVLMNIHIKGSSDTGGSSEYYPPETFKKIVDLIEKYGCKDYVYIAGCKDVLETAFEMAPDIARCCLEGQYDYTLVENAILYDCKKIQIYKPYFTQELIDKAHANNIRCNIFWADNVAEAKSYLQMGIDTILTNDFLSVKVGLFDRRALRGQGS